MQAECTFQAFDNRTATHYVPGPVPDFDVSNDRLNSLTVPGKGTWVFQDPGHEGGPRREGIVPAPVTVETKPEVKVDKRKQPMSAERRAKLKQQLAAGREAKQAKKEALIAETEAA